MLAVKHTQTIIMALSVMGPPTVSMNTVFFFSPPIGNKIKDAEAVWGNGALCWAHLSTYNDIIHHGARGQVRTCTHAHSARVHAALNIRPRHTEQQRLHVPSLQVHVGEFLRVGRREHGGPNLRATMARNLGPVREPLALFGHQLQGRKPLTVGR